MPHFVIDCSENVINHRNLETIMTKVHQTAEASGLFESGDIKVRINPFQHTMVGGEFGSFIHVFANIMEGRTTEQKANLSRAMVKTLTGMFPDVPNIAMNVRDFERSTYCNRNMI